jgi:hypothetical protein
LSITSLSFEIVDANHSHILVFLPHQNRLAAPVVSYCSTSQ